MTARAEAQRDAEAAIAAAVEAATAVARREASREREAIEAAALRAEAALAAQRQEEARRTAEFEALTAAMEADNSFSMSLPSSARPADLNSPASPTLRGGESGRRTPDWLQKAVSDLADERWHGGGPRARGQGGGCAAAAGARSPHRLVARARIARSCICGVPLRAAERTLRATTRHGRAHHRWSRASLMPRMSRPHPRQATWCRPYVPYVSQQEVRHLPMMPPRDTMTESAAASLRNTMRTHAELHVSWSLYMKLAMRSVANTMTCSR